MKQVLVVMGSISDLDKLRPCIDTLSAFGVPHSVRVCSAHRTPELAAELSKSAYDNGFGVIIAAAGKAAHLAGVMAAHTTLPVIGVPIGGSATSGLDSLLSTVQMPSGVPVATVAVDGAMNAAILAVQILSLCEPNYVSLLHQHRERLADDSASADAKLREVL